MPSTLVLDPATAFLQLRDALSSAGWRLVSSAERPILPDEPEHAVFERGADERAFYTFNPVCHLRVLDVEGVVDPAALAPLAPVGREQIESWLASDDDRTVLRGVLASRQMMDMGLLERVFALRGHPSQAIADAAVRASEQFRERIRGGAEAEDAARARALAALEVVREQVQPLLRALSFDRSGAALELVRPKPDDYAKAFVAEAVDRAREAFQAVWDESIDMAYPDGAQTNITCEIAPAGMLSHDNELSRRFPGGYRAISHLLDPRRVWVCWKCLRPGAATGMAYDGLVWLDDHWAWFPKPYRVLGK